MTEPAMGASAGAPTPRLELRAISKRFETSTGKTVDALRDVSLSVGDGEFVSFVGPSGCGKTTLLRIMDGLIAPSSGTVCLDGQPITKPGANRAVVFQQDSLFPWRTVHDNVLFGLEVQGKPSRQRQEAAAEKIALVGLAGFERAYPHELSGGMRQRVNLARALAVDPQVLLMDEPFASLDAQTREIMQAELLRIWNARRKTVVFITHQIDEAIYLSDRVVVLATHPGRVREVIPIGLERPRHLSVKRTAAFGEIHAHIWSAVESEVLQALHLSTA